MFSYLSSSMCETNYQMQGPKKFFILIRKNFCRGKIFFFCSLGHHHHHHPLGILFTKAQESAGVIMLLLPPVFFLWHVIVFWHVRKHFLAHGVCRSVGDAGGPPDPAAVCVLAQSGPACSGSCSALSLCPAPWRITGNMKTKLSYTAACWVPFKHYLHPKLLMLWVTDVVIAGMSPKRQEN